MSSNYRNDGHPLTAGRVIGIVFGFIFWWPIGLYLLIKTIRQVEEYENTMAKIRRESNSTYSSSNEYKRGNAKDVQFADNGAYKSSKRGVGLRLKQLLLNVFGALFSIAGIGALLDMISYGFYLDEFLTSGIFFGGGVGMLFLGNEIKKKLKRYKKYAAVIGDAESMPVESIAAKIPTTFDRACKELEDMIDEGYFGDGAYINMKNYRFNRNANADIFEEDASRDSIKSFQNNYMEIIDQIKQLKLSIENEAVSAKIIQIQNLTTKIFKVLEEQPEKKTILRTFMNYYLPTTLKLLNDYRRLETQGNKSPTVAKAMGEIEKILDTLVLAFEQQLDATFKEDVLDISSEISALESMMAQDFAISEDPFKQKEENKSLNSDGTLDE